MYAIRSYYEELTAGGALADQQGQIGPVPLAHQLIGLVNALQPLATNAQLAEALLHQLGQGAVVIYQPDERLFHMGSNGRGYPLWCTRSSGAAQPGGLSEMTG